MTPPQDPTSNSDEHTLRIDRVVAGGDGLARRADGCAVFVPRTAPGDVVEVEYTEERKNWKRARVVRVVESGPGRGEPACPYYERCGGCQLQHLNYSAQLDVKAGIVIDALRRLGGVTLERLAVEPSARQVGYRNRVSLTLRTAGSTLLLGYHGQKDPNEIVSIASCPIAEDPVNNAWAALRENLRDVVRLGNADARLTIRATTEGRVGLAIEGESGGTAISKAVTRIDAFDAVWWLDRKGRVISGKGDDHLDERWGPYEFPIAGSAFLQVNREAATVLDDYVREQCHGAEGRKVVDAYCGFGLRALELARDGASVTAIDIDHRSIDAASRLSVQHGIPVHFVAAPVERALTSYLPADIVVLNPPRRGVAAEVVDTLNKQQAQHIVYVSCDPATLARDIKRLSQNYALTECRAFDLFPQTSHVETVATLQRIE